MSSLMNQLDFSSLLSSSPSQNQNPINEEDLIIRSNYEMAYEIIPESFFKIKMIYIEGQINNQKLRIFVDTGASTSIMTLSKCKQLNLDYLIDNKAKSKASGIGEGNIIGRVHYFELQLNDCILPMGISILENMNCDDFDILLGLDVLTTHGVLIDLVKKQLIFKNYKIPFI